MQIVIDISEKLYNRMKTYQGLDDTYIAVKHGILLPEGHGRLIDENDLWFEDIDDISCVTQRNVENAPTIIEAERSDKG